ncbi:MAG: hypothetical protein DSY55_00665, partial [Clostridia bacterium]
MIAPPLTPNAIAYAWERLLAIAGAHDPAPPHAYGPADAPLPRPGVVIVPAAPDAWAQLLEARPGRLTWLPAADLFPAGYPRPFDDAVPVLFESDAGGGKPPIWIRKDGSIVFHIDLIAATLFMLTRWEEVVLPRRDEHDRFPAAESVAYRQGFLDQPIVDRYAMILRAWLQKLQPSWQPQHHQFQLRLSHDIDHLRRFETAGLAIRQAGRDLLREKNIARAWRDASDYVQGRWRFARSPYLLALEHFADQAEALNTRAVFYVLAGGDAIYDTGYDVTNPIFRHILLRLHERGHIIGLHPSYETYLDPQRYLAEKTRLENILGFEVRHARQHYLRFRIPNTWRTAAEAGVQEDATLGYAQREGFRCGTAHPFPVFDIITDKTLPLTEMPLHVMDGTLKEYQRLTPEESRQRLRLMARRVAEVAGTLQLLWHNHAALPPWTRWREAYSQF